MMKKGIYILLFLYVFCINLNTFAQEEAIGYFPFEFITEKKCGDKTNTFRDAEINGNGTLTSGISGNGIFLDGINASIEISDTNGKLNKGGMISFWFKPKTKNNLTEESPVIKVGEKLIVGLSDESKQFYISANEDKYDVNYVVKENEWYNITLVMNNDDFGLYVNGNLVQEVSGAYITANGKISFGTDGENYCYGTVDEINIYNNVLDDSKINGFYTDMMNKITEWESIAFPWKSMFPNGIGSINAEILKSSKLSQPLFTGYEERNEINAVNAESYRKQLEISEDKYNGKFALKILKNYTDIIPIKESSKFKSGSLKNVSTDNKSAAEQYISENGINISIKDKHFIVEGKTSDAETTICLMNGGDIAYINQCENDANGRFIFEFDVLNYGNYALSVGGTNGIRLRENINVVGNEKIKVESIETKCNYFTVMIKPMYKSENLSFYTKAEVVTNSGIKEEYVLIKSDSDGDGVFRVGDELSRGKWQKIELNLLDIDQENLNGVFSGLYMNANEGSEWLFDDISSGFRKINKNDLNLAAMAFSNVVINDNKLQFGPVNSQLGYNVNSSVIMGNTNINEKISGFVINDSVKQLSDSQSEEKIIISNEPLDSEKWMIGEGNAAKNENKILLKSDMSSIYYESDFESKGRVKINMECNFPYDHYGSNWIHIYIYDENKVNMIYKVTERFNYLSSEEKALSLIVPKIEEKYIIEIIYEHEQNPEYPSSYFRPSDVVISSISFEELSSEELKINTKLKGYSVASKIYCYFSETSMSKKTVRDMVGEEYYYAVDDPDTLGIVNDTQNSISYSYSYPYKGTVVCRLINFSDERVKISIGSDSYNLDYGEQDIIAYTSNTKCSIGMPANDKIMLVSMTNYYSKEPNPNNMNDVIVNGLYDVCQFSEDGNKVFYKNICDNNFLYEYDFETREYKCISQNVYEKIIISPDNRYLFTYKYNEGLLIDVMNGQETTISGFGDDSSFVFSSKDELYSAYKGNIRKYIDDTWVSNEFVQNNDNKDIIFDFNDSGEYMVAAYNIDNTSSDIYIYQKYNGIWNKVKKITIPYSISKDNKCILSNDITSIYLQTNKDLVIDIASGAISIKEFPGRILRKNSDGTLICYKNEYYFIFNPTINKSYKIFEESFTTDLIAYYPKNNNIVMFMTGYDTVGRFEFSEKRADVRYLLSFDGRNNWYSYSNGRWILASKSSTPSETEMISSGMTSEQVNEIPESAIDKLYQNGSDVLNVDFAAYMSSNSNKETPVIEKISVHTLEDDGLNGIYGINVAKFDKADYRKVNSVFPIENFESNAECYYLLYIGNDWLYTYKNGKLSKVVESADELLEDIDESWITFKQYGLTAAELRNIPSGIFNDLFVNENYANTEFGIIYVVKTDDTDSSGYTVNFRLQSESNYITKDDVVIEIVMSGNDVKLIDSNEFSKNEIEDLLSWIEARQNGSGDIFHIVKNTSVQYMINYYMINSINIYNGEEYRNKNSEPQEIDLATE